MKILITAYTFDASAKTITFTGYGTLSLESVLLITNVTDNIIIYNFADPTKGGTVATNVLTLDYDTTTMDDADDIQIYYDDPSATQAISDGGGSVTVDGSVTVGSALPAGTNAIGKLAANDGVDIGDVTINNASGGSAVNIQDGGNSITVDGTVTANAGTNLNTSALALAATQTDKSQFTKLTDGTDTALITASGELNVLATAQPGVDIGDVTINNASGAAAVNIQDGGNSITVDGTVAATQSGTWTVQPGNTANTTAWKVDGSAVTQPVSGTVTSSNTTGNVAAAATDSGNPVKVGGKYNTTMPTYTDGQRGDAEITSRGAVKTALFVDASATPVAAVATNADAVAASSIASHLETASRGSVYNGTTWDRQRGDTTGTYVVGSVAHDGVDSGNPLKTGGQARTTNPTAVSDADRSNFITDKLGKQVVVGSIRDLKGTQQTAITSSTSETTIVTAIASTFCDVYGIVITNTSATACNVTIKDSTAGTTRFVFAVPAGDTRGFMLSESAGHAQATVNNNWTATCSASVASIQITALYVKNI